MENENIQQMAGETKQAETRLKEMSRKAKQKGKDKKSSKTESTPPIFNQNWFYIVIGLAGITGITHLIYQAQSKGGQQDFKFTLVRIPEKTDAKSDKEPQKSVEVEEKQDKKTLTLFELNSF